MKKTIIIAVAIILVVGMFVSMHSIIGDKIEETLLGNEGSNNIGEAMMNMERESKKAAEKIISELTVDNLASFVTSFEEEVQYIIDNIEKLEDEDTRIQVMSKCALIRNLSGDYGSKKELTDLEKALNENDIVVFCNLVFSYCLSLNDNNEEKLDKMKIDLQAKKVEENQEVLLEEFFNDLLQTKN